ncbi:Panacea domain-containing protein [Rhodopirellula halodulae]|uniref:Panacea domain-containing protein n=1 Tax=Rhodopirellula halodulae TaxID=2894198 RepID=UPI001E390F72|nr:Panacea domain-containing protein [Rhodopirellula sp. JC737]MCC9655602.1 SocA family protein [Rhodopirellula sp. JC737]
MDTLQDIIAYLLKHYPHKNELSNARLTKMVYLADWRNAVLARRQLTDIDWYFDNYGPFVSDVKQAVQQEPDIFTVRKTENLYGNSKTLIELNDDSYQPSLSKATKEVLDHVIETTKQLGWNGFISLVYGTYPIASSPRYSMLDLVALASKYVDRQK